MTVLRYQPATEDHEAGYFPPPLHATLREHGDAARRSPVKGGFVNLMSVSLASIRIGEAFQSLIRDTAVDESGEFSFPPVDDFVDRHFSELGLSADILSQEAPLRQCLDRVIEDVLQHAAAVFRRDTLIFAKEQELSISLRQLQPIIDRQIALLKAQLLDLMPVFVQALFRRYLRNAAGLADAYLKFYETAKSDFPEHGRPRVRGGKPNAGRAVFDDSSPQALRLAIDTRKRELIFQVLAVANAYAGLGQRPLTLLDQPVSVTPDMSDAERNFVASVAALASQQTGAVLSDSSSGDGDPADVSGDLEFCDGDVTVDEPFVPHEGLEVDEGVAADGGFSVDEGRIASDDLEESVDEVSPGAVDEPRLTA